MATSTCSVKSAVGLGSGNKNLLFKSMVLNLYKNPEPLRGFLSFCRTPFSPNITENKNCCDITTLLVMFQMTFLESLKRFRRTIGVRSNPG